jgi:arginyl-tRNA synthetase
VTRGDVGAAVLAAVRGAVAEGELAVPVPVQVPVYAMAAGECSSPLPLRLARAAARPARDVAAVLAERLVRQPGVRGVRVTGPGFLTIDVDASLAGRVDGVIDVPCGTWPVRPLTFDNPGFRVRFAYARAAAVRRHAADLGICAGSGPADEPPERRLLGLLAGFPGRTRQARPVIRHLELIADAYHDVHERCPALPRGDEPITGVHAARLGLAEAVRVTVGDCLRLLGEVPSERPERA